MIKRIAFVTIVILGVLFLWNNWSAQQNKDVKLESIINQQVMTDELNNNLDRTNVEQFIQSVSTITEVVVFKETGIANISYNKFDASWNKWLTNSDITLNLEYKAIITIPTDSIKLELKNDTLYITYSEKSFGVESLEITNKQIFSDRSVFGKSFTDDEKIALERTLVNGIKDEMLTKERLSECSVSLEYLLSNLAEELGIKVRFNK